MVQEVWDGKKRAGCPGAREGGDELMLGVETGFYSVLLKLYAVED